MGALIIYFLKVNVVISILFLAYFFLFRKLKFFRLNRFFLIGTMLFSLVLPILPAIKSLPLFPFQREGSFTNPFRGKYWGFGEERAGGNDRGTLDKQEPAAASGPSSQKAGPVIPLTSILAGLYLVVALILLTKFLLQLRRLFLLIKRSESKISEGIRYCEHEMELPPFSFFHYLVINRSSFTPEQSDQVVVHEKVHIRQWHTLDLLFAECMHIFLWVNPLVLALKRAVKLNLEYIVDENVLNTGIDRQAYQFSILSCLKLPAFPLANLFNSSKIKLRITMMNTENPSARQLLKYAIVLPVLATAYFIINPLSARSLPPSAKIMGDNPGSTRLRPFEGIYQNQMNKEAYVQLIAKNQGIFLRQIWNNKEMELVQQSELAFSAGNEKLQLHFTKDKQGNIVQFLGFGKDLWNRINEYKRDTTITLTPEQLKAFEGYYTFQFEKGKDAYIQIRATGDGLVLKQLWDGEEIQFSARGALDFIGKDRPFPLKFSKDKNDTVTQVLAFDRDLWTKVPGYKPPVIKTDRLTTEQLKALEGRYQFQFEPGKDAYIQIRADEGGLVLKQEWDGKEFPFVAESDLAFYCKEHPDFTLKFTKDKDGTATQVLAFDKDLWNKVKK